MKRIILSAGFALAVLTFPTSALADSPICHNGVLSDDVGQGCTNDGQYGGPPTAPSSSSSNYAICHDGSLSDDVGQGCTNNGTYVAQATQAVSASPPSTLSTSYSGSGGYADVPGVPSSFASCVAMRESTNGAGSSNIYGIQGPGGQGSIAEQKQAFAQMYAARGTQPWSPYDGC